MDKNSKILILVFIAVILVSIFLTYKRAFVDRDFEILEEEAEEGGLEEEATKEAGE
jgi:hypothetical protein